MYTRDVKLSFPNNSIKKFTLNFCTLCHNFDQFSGEWPTYIYIHTYIYICMQREAFWIQKLKTLTLCGLNTLDNLTRDLCYGVCVCVYVRERERGRDRVCVCISVCMCVYVCVCVCVCTDMQDLGERACVCVSVSVCVCMVEGVCWCVCVCARVWVCAWVWRCVGEPVTVSCLPWWGLFQGVLVSVSVYRVVTVVIT